MTGGNLGYAFNYTDITTTPVTVKSGPGTLHAIVVGTVGTVTAITVADATSGTSPAIAVTGTPTQGTLYFDCIFNNGLTITTTGTGNITAIWL
jgi:uncharacterized protein YraI